MVRCIVFLIILLLVTSLPTVAQSSRDADEAAIKALIENQTAHFNQGNLEAILSNWVQDHRATRTWVGRAVERDLTQGGYYLLDQERVDDAIALFRVYAKLFPQSGIVYAGLGEAYAKAGNTERAAESYEKALQRNPDDMSVREALARLKQE